MFTIPFLHLAVLCFKHSVLIISTGSFIMAEQKLAIFAFLTCLVMTIPSCSALEGKHAIKREVSNEQTSCFSTLLSTLTKGESSCVNVGNAITSHFGSDIAAGALSLDDSAFSVFCRPTCGRNALVAWQSCNITSSYDDEIQAFVGICGRDNGAFCYQSLGELFEFINDVEDCSMTLANTGQCSDDCRSIVRDGEHMFGCCSHVPVNLRIYSEGGDSQLNDAVDTTFQGCQQDEWEGPCDGILINESFSFNRLVEDNLSLSPEQIVCISNTLSDELQESDTECRAVAGRMLVLINSDDLLLSISEDQSTFSGFCRPSCGPAVIEAWKTCTAYDSIKAKADLLVGLCNLNGDTTCYSQYDGLMQFIDNSFHCGQTTGTDPSVFTTCPSGCFTAYRNGVEEFDCCTDVILEYVNSVVNGASDELTNSLFDLCDTEIPDQCDSTALTATAIGLMPASGLILLAAAIASAMAFSIM